MRVESDSKASCAIESMRSNFLKNSFLSWMAAGAVLIGGAGVQNAFNVGAAGKMHSSSGGVHRQLMRKVAGQLAWVGGQEGFQVADVAEGAAVGESAAGVHRAGYCVKEIVSGMVDAGHAFAFRRPAVMRALAAEHIEGLKRQSSRVELGVARRAGGRLGM